MSEVKIPQVGESITTGTLSQWHVANGDQVEVGQSLFSLETDKVTQEIEADAAGLIELLVAAGDEVSIGQVVAKIEAKAESGEGADDGGESSKDDAEESQQPEIQATEGQNEVQADPGTEDEPKAGETEGETEKAPNLAAAADSEQAQEREHSPEAEGEQVPEAEEPLDQPIAEGDATATDQPSGGGRQVEVKVPPVGESVSSGTLSNWLVADGHQVTQGQPLFSLETDKITQEVEADAAGTLRHGIGEGSEVQIGQIVGTIEIGSGSSAPVPTTAPLDKPQTEGGIPADKPAPSADPPQRVRDSLADAASRFKAQQAGTSPAASKTPQLALVRRDSEKQEPPTQAPAASESDGRVTRRKMTQLRRKIARHLVNAQQTAAILTTFNEVDMTAVMGLRKELQDGFVARHGVKLGFMSFFVKAVVEALKEVPAVNARIEGEDIMEQHYYDIGVAVGTPKGLVVPVLRDADQKGFAQIEKEILEYAERAKNGKLDLSDLQGGVFTISNGGVYGSLLSTPILNPPQSGILGMHTIQERPVALNGQVVIRPMMYLALSYDHRLVDGKEAVSFLIRIKQCLELPTRLLVGA